MSFAVLCVSFSRSEYMFDEQPHQAECLFILVITYLLFKQIINHALQLMSHLCTCENFFFSPHRISGDRLCCVHLLDGWKKVFRSPEKKIKYHCYLTAVISHNAPLYITLRITAINQCEFAFVVLSYLKLLIPQCGICVLCFNLMASAGNKSCCFTGTLAFLSR